MDGQAARWVSAAILEAFDKGELDADVLRAFDRPVYFALAGRSNPDYFGRMAERLAATVPGFHGRERFRSDITSTRRTASNPSTWPTRCSHARQRAESSARRLTA